MQVYDMIGWRQEGPDRFLYYQTDAVPLCLVMRIDETVAQVSGNRPNDWGFECRLQNGTFVHRFFNADLPLDHVKREAADTMSQLIRNNETVH